MNSNSQGWVMVGQLISVGAIKVESLRVNVRGKKGTNCMWLKLYGVCGGN